MTYSHNSCSIKGEISPVKAPCSSQYMFWAPRPTWVPVTIDLTASRAVKGGHKTTSTPLTLATASQTSWANALASATVLYIFQLPAIIGFRMINLQLLENNLEPVS